jgi:hypothetical protein
VRRPATELERSALELAAQVGTAKRSRAMSARQVEAIMIKARSMLAAGDWSKAGPGHLVTLWAVCHEHVYGVRPVEDLAPPQFSRACMKAAKVLKESFSGDSAKMAGFISWVWAREKGRKGEARRIGWPLMFSSALVGDWRVGTAGRNV